MSVLRPPLGLLCCSRKSARRAKPDAGTVFEGATGSEIYKNTVFLYTWSDLLTAISCPTCAHLTRTHASPLRCLRSWCSSLLMVLLLLLQVLVVVLLASVCMRPNMKNIRSQVYSTLRHPERCNPKKKQQAANICKIWCSSQLLRSVTFSGLPGTYLTQIVRCHGVSFHCCSAATSSSQRRFVTPV